MEQNQLFRQKSLDKVSASEKTNSFLRVVNPGILFLLAAIIVAIIGIFIWVFFGTVDSKMEVVFHSDGEKTELYVSEDKIGNITQGCDIRIGDKTGKVRNVSPVAMRAGEVMDDYIIHLNGYTGDTWVFQIDTDFQIDPGIYKAEIIRETISPFQMIIGK